MRPLHKWQSLNTLFYLHYLSPSEARRSREGGWEGQPDPFQLFSDREMCMVFLRLIQLKHEYRIASLFFLLTFSTLCRFFPVVSRGNAQHWYGQCGLVRDQYCYHIPPSPRCKKPLTFNVITLTYTVSDIAQAYPYPSLPAFHRHLGRVNRRNKTYYWFEFVFYTWNATKFGSPTQNLNPTSAFHSACSRQLHYRKGCCFSCRKLVAFQCTQGNRFRRPLKHGTLI